MNDFLELGKKYKDTKGSDADVEAFKRIFERMQECIASVAETSPKAPSPTSARRAGGTGLPACDAYIETMEKYLACDKIPQATRDAARQGIELMKQGWGDVESLPDSVKEQTNDACRDSVDALHQGARALGCKL